MTDFASQSASQSTHDVGTDDHAHRNILPGTLKLSGDGQALVYVIRVPNISPATSAFGHHRSGDFYTDGISWVNDSKFAKFINFHLLQGVERLYCNQLPYSDVKSQHQQFAILHNSPAEYSFTVKFTTGEPHDPQIVVTLPGKAEPSC